MPSRAVQTRIREKMEERGIPSDAIEGFWANVRRMALEKSAYVPLDEVSAPDSSLVFDIEAESEEIRDLEERGLSLLSKVVVIKLNGGRSTTMGGEVPKGVLVAKDGMSYLEIIARQTEAQQKKWDVDTPLVLMNSFFTHHATLDVIDRFGIPIEVFLQNQVPRLIESTLNPLQTGTEDDWAPPGHGDVYESLGRSGLLRKFLQEGRQWAFVSNLDNLAAVVEPWILGLIDREKMDFLMEVTDRTEADRKGGTLVVRDGRLDLLEIAQVCPGEEDRFMDVDRFRVFNTNNLWVDLHALALSLESKALALPIIQNRKRVGGCSVVQIETAMGAACRCFSRAGGLRVGRDRFHPTKRVEDLFLLQSDVSVLDSMFRLRANPGRPENLMLRPRVVFGSDFLDSPLKMDSGFEDSTSVSLVHAESFEVFGSVFFERDVRIEGKVTIKGPSEGVCRIPRGSVLQDTVFP